VLAHTPVLPISPACAILNHTALCQVSTNIHCAGLEESLRSSWQPVFAIIIRTLGHVRKDRPRVTRWPECPIQANHRTSCNWPRRQVRWFRTNNPTSGISSALEVDKCQIYDGSVSLDRSEDSIRYRDIVWVREWLVALFIIPMSQLATWENVEIPTS
jgi:hypothetical protein